jgi:hypothetical protein
LTLRGRRSLLAAPLLALLALLAPLVTAPPARAQTPIPTAAPVDVPPCPPHLFVIARSKNANIVAYDANRGPAGDFVASTPVVAYWLLNGEGGVREELGFIDRTRAYGFDTVPGHTPGTFKLTFKAGKKKSHLTIRMLNGCPVATGRIAGHDAILRRMFVQAKETSRLPKVEYVEFFGEDVKDGAPLHEKITH